MSNFKDILEKLCKQKHYSCTDQMLDAKVMDANYGIIKNIIYEAVEIYTNEICKEQRHICAENAFAEIVKFKLLNGVKNDTYAVINKESILNCKSPLEIKTE